VALDIIHTPSKSTGKIMGGSAFHFANAASRWASIGIVGVVGEDYPFAKAEFLKKRGVDFSGVDVKPGNTFLWEGRYLKDFKERETIRTELGVFEDFNPVLPEHFRKPKILFLAAIEPRLQLQVLKQVVRPKLVAIDTFKLWIDIARKDFMKVLKQSDLLFVDEFEARWLTGESSLFKAARALRKIGPQWVIVKKGEHGSFLTSDKGLFLSGTYPVDKVIDPTGAGDSYAGATMGYLAKHGKISDASIMKAMGWASVVGSMYVEGFGPDGLKGRTMADLNRRHRDLRKLTTMP
jgi:sugar/nucleoside kinase (ribokinase family)